MTDFYSLVLVSREFSFQLPTESKIAPVGNSDSVLNFKADNVDLVDGSKIAEIIFNVKVMKSTVP